MAEKQALQYVLTKCASWTAPNGKKYVKDVPVTPADAAEAEYIQTTNHFEVIRSKVESK